MFVKHGIPPNLISTLSHPKTTPRSEAGTTFVEIQADRKSDHGASLQTNQPNLTTVIFPDVVREYLEVYPKLNGNKAILQMAITERGVTQIAITQIDITRIAITQIAVT